MDSKDDLAIDMNASDTEVTVVIPNWNGLHWLRVCLPALAAQTRPPERIIVVDNGSTDGSPDYIRAEYPAVQVVGFNENRGFAAAANAGIRKAATPLIALMNNDTLPEPGWLEALIDAARNTPPDVACFASCMVSMDDPNIIDDAGDAFSWTLVATKRGHGRPRSAFREPCEVFSACAGAALYRTALFEQIGLFDEMFESYLEDIDIGLRARAHGFTCRYVPDAVIRHQGHGSSLARGRYAFLMTRNRLLLAAKNMPRRRWWKYLPGIVVSQLYFFVAYRRPFHSLAGYAAFLVRMPGVLRRRKNNDLQS